MRSLFEYIDYRKYLEAYYSHKKRTKRSFSYRYFAQKAKIASPSFLKEVMDGKRNLTRPMIENFCIGLELTPKESVYFKNLVLFNQARTSVEKQEHYINMRSLFGAVKESVLNADQHDYFAKWYIPVIRELVCVFDFRDDYKLIASSLIPAILPSEAKAAVMLLLRLNLLKRKKNGLYSMAESAIVADNSIISMAMRSFAQMMIEHSKQAIENINWRIRHVSTTTVGISPATYEVLAAEIEAFKDRVKLIVSRDEESSQVYQMNVTLFPVSKNTKDLKKSKAQKK